MHLKTRIFALLWLLSVAAPAQTPYLLRSALALHRDGDASRALRLADSAWQSQPDIYAWARVCEAAWLHPFYAKKGWYAAPRYREIGRFSTPVVSADLSADGKLAAATDAQGQAMLWETDSKHFYSLGTAKSVAHLGFDSANQIVAAFFRKGGVQAWYTSPGPARGMEADLLVQPAPSASLGMPIRQELPPALQNLAGVSVARYNADSSLLLTAHFDGRVLLWNLRAHPVWQLAGPGLLLSDNTGPKGEIAVAEGAAITVIWPDGHKRQGINGHERPINSLKFDADGFIWTSAGDKSVRRWDTLVGGTPRKWLDEAGTYAFTSQLDLQPGSGLLAVATGWAGTNLTASEVVLWNQQQKKVATCTGHQGNVRQVAFLQDKTLVSGSDDGTAIRWDANGKLLTQLFGFVGSVRVVAALPNGGFLLCDDVGGHCYDAKNKKTAFLDQAFIKSVALHPSLPVVFTAGAAGASAWSLAGEHLWTFPFEQALQVAVSTDGKWLFLRTYDGIFRICIAPTMLAR